MRPDPMPPRAVITGMGACTPMAASVPELCQAVLAGTSAIRTAPRFAGTPFADVPMSVFEQDPAGHAGQRHLHWADRGAQFMLAALDEALAQARWDTASTAPERVAVVVGTSHSGIESAERVFRATTAVPPAAMDRRWLAASSVDHPASVLCRRLGALGPKFTFSSACASSNTALGMAAELIADDVADTVFVVGTDTVSLSILAGFGSLRALGRQATAPFSLPVGLTLGEGGGVMVVENLAQARRRGAAPLAEILGCGLSGDAHHETAPDAQGRGVSAAIGAALAASGVDPASIDLVSAHGTGTDANDGPETLGTYRMLPPGVPITSSKSFLGHTLGASGLLELMLALGCAERGHIPPTARFTTLRPGCREDADYVHGQPREAAVDLILKNNFGFGGNNSSLVVRRSVAEDRRRIEPAQAVVVTALGAVSAAGASWSALAEAQWQGRPCTAVSEGYARPVGLVGTLALPPAYRPWARSSPMLRFGVLAAADALAAAALPSVDDGGVGLICGVMNGAERSIERYFASVFQEGPQFASAMHFPMTTLNAMGGAISIAHHLRGFNTTLSAGQAALAYGFALLRRGRQRAVLVASGDELTPPLAALFADIMPAAGAAPGEAAMALVLEPLAEARRRGATPLAQLHAVAQVQDGRLAGPDPAGRGVARALRQALSSAAFGPGDVCQVVLSVPPLARFEQAAREGLHAALGTRTPVWRVDAVVGHCPSSAFTMALGLAIESMQRGALPPPHAGTRVRGPVLVLGIGLLGDISCALLGPSQP